MIYFFVHLAGFFGDMYREIVEPKKKKKGGENVNASLLMYVSEEIMTSGTMQVKK